MVIRHAEWLSGMFNVLPRVRSMKTLTQCVGNKELKAIFLAQKIRSG